MLVDAYHSFSFHSGVGRNPSFEELALKFHPTDLRSDFKVFSAESSIDLLRVQQSAGIRAFPEMLRRAGNFTFVFMNLSVVFFYLRILDFARPPTRMEFPWNSAAQNTKIKLYTTRWEIEFLFWIQ